MADNARPLILLTRPRAQALRFAAMLGALVDIQISPLQEIVPSGPVPPLNGFRGLIFTSENAVSVLATSTPARDVIAWCVGARTAQAAEEAGFHTQTAGGTADALIEAIVQAAPAAPLLHLHGRHTRGDVAARLTAQGITTQAAEIYDQVAIAPTPPIEPNAQPIIAPLFSPRSAQLLAPHVDLRATHWHFPCLSEAVRDALPQNFQKHASVAAAKDANAMVSLVKRHISP